MAQLARPASGFRVADVAAHVGFALPPGAEPALDAWLTTLAAWNAKIDLTAAKTADALAELMLTDALVLAREIPAGGRVVDVGTGAGAPGLALALARPDLRLTLVEPLQKRVAFLRTVIGSADFPGGAMPELLARRGEDLPRGAWDVAVSRATLAPEAWVALGCALVAPGGSVWALLAQAGPPEAPAGARGPAVSRYTLPFSGAPRAAARYDVAGA